MNLYAPVWQGSDNHIALELTDRGRLIDGGISLLNRAVLRLTPDDGGPDVVVDSDTAPGVFDWNTEGADSVLRVSLGVLSPAVLPAGTYAARLWTDDGSVKIVWADPRDQLDFRIDVFDDPAVAA